MVELPKRIIDAWSDRIVERIESDIFSQLGQRMIGGDAMNSTTSGTQVTPPLTLDVFREFCRKAEALDPIEKVPKLWMRPFPKVQVKKHRRKRINKKWLKRYGFREDTSVDKGQGILMRFTNYFGGEHVLLVVYPFTFERMKHALRQEQMERIYKPWWSV